MDIGLVCDSCSTFNPMGSRGCSRCGAVLSLDSSPRLDDAATPEAESLVCATCGKQVGSGQRFCNGCGSSMNQEAQRAAASLKAAPNPVAKKPSAGKKTLFFGAMQAARAKLVLIKGDGLDGVSFTLAGEEHVAGRVDAPLAFEEDPFLSPRHANFFYRNGELVVRDESSANGVFIRIRGSRTMEPGDRFLVGEQVIEVQNHEDEDEPLPEADGTYFYASPHAKTKYRLLQVLRGGGTGLAFIPYAEIVSLGREDNDVNFPDDPFISGHHAQVSFAVGGEVALTDLGSKNGTFMRVRDESALEHGDYVFMGQQLLRVEIV